MICQMCYEEEAIEGDTLCENCKLTNIDDGDTLDDLIAKMGDVTESNH